MIKPTKQLEDATLKQLEQLSKQAPRGATHIWVRVQGKPSKYIPVKEAWSLEGLSFVCAVGKVEYRPNSKRVSKFHEMEWTDGTTKRRSKVDKEKQLENRIAKSKVKNPCEAVWDICDKNKDKPRKEILALCEKAGIAFYTARTQYQLWRSAGKSGSN